MKQKLLNLFTWRATLLVALLCTSFGNAWGQTTNTLTFTVGNSDSWPTNDGITWSTTKGTTWSGSEENVLTSSSITGSVKDVIVTAKGGHGQSEYTINVEVGDIDFGTQTSTGQSSTSKTFEKNPAVNVNDKTIKITIKITNKPNKNVTLENVKVTYVSEATIPAPGALDKDADPAKYYGTYSNKCQFVVPSSGLTVSKVSVSGGTLTVTDLSGTIPANTGVMISASDNTTSYTVDLKLATVSALSGNMLRPTGDGIDNENTVMSGPDPDETYKFYYLTMNGDQIGFYRRNDTGAAFPMNVPNKAYLAVPEGEVEPKTEGNEGDVKGFAFGDDTNGIKAVETEKAESNAIYNLAGQRVSKMQKGIYVVNGKKVLVK